MVGGSSFWLLVQRGLESACSFCVFSPCHCFCCTFLLATFGACILTRAMRGMCRQCFDVIAALHCIPASAFLGRGLGGPQKKDLFSTCLFGLPQAQESPPWQVDLPHQLSPANGFSTSLHQPMTIQIHPAQPSAHAQQMLHNLLQQSRARSWASGVV